MIGYGEEILNSLQVEAPAVPAPNPGSSGMGKGKGLVKKSSSLSRVGGPSNQFSISDYEEDLFARIYKQDSAAAGPLQPNTYQQECEMYLAEAPLSLKADPLDWWRANAFRYPILSKLAAQIFCVPATSCPSERVFSTAGNVITEDRASLSPEHANMIVFLYENHARRSGNIPQDPDDDSDDDADSIASDSSGSEISGAEMEVETDSD